MDFGSFWEVTFVGDLFDNNSGSTFEKKRWLEEFSNIDTGIRILAPSEYEFPRSSKQLTEV